MYTAQDSRYTFWPVYTVFHRLVIDLCGPCFFRERQLDVDRETESCSAFTEDLNGYCLFHLVDTFLRAFDRIYIDVTIHNIYVIL